MNVQNNDPIILGIDPGYGICGFSVVQKKRNNFSVLDYGVITTEKNIRFQYRLVELAESISELLTQYSPRYLAIEKLFWGANKDNAIRVAEARGVIEMLCAQAGMTIYEYSPNEIKSKLVGHGKAPKFQVQNILKMRLGLDEIPTPDDAADALGIAIVCAEELKSNPDI